jgi:flagellar basal body-associated protein FliL
MYSTRTIIILLLIAVALFCVSLFLLLVWMPQSEEPVRETTREETLVEITVPTPEISDTGNEAPVSQTNEPEVSPLGSDHGMEFPTMDGELPPQ